jgi:hypothetical protein
MGACARVRTAGEVFDVCAPRQQESEKRIGRRRAIKHILTPYGPNGQFSFFDEVDEHVVGRHWRRRCRLATAFCRRLASAGASVGESDVNDDAVCGSIDAEIVRVDSSRSRANARKESQSGHLVQRLVSAPWNYRQPRQGRGDFPRDLRRARSTRASGIGDSSSGEVTAAVRVPNPRGPGSRLRGSIHIGRRQPASVAEKVSRPFGWSADAAGINKSTDARRVAGGIAGTRRRCGRAQLSGPRLLR